MARRLLAANPSLDDAEWKEQIKRAVVAQRLRCPLPHVITDAMDRTERALGMPRQSSRPISPSGPPAAEARPLSDSEAKAALSSLIARYGPLPPMKPRPNHGAAFLEHLRTLVRLKRAQREPPSVEEVRGAHGTTDGRPPATGDGSGSRGR